MKDNKKIEDYNDYKKGQAIASQIGDIMQCRESAHKDLDEWIDDAELSGETIERLSSETIFTAMYNNFDRAEKHDESRHLTSSLRNRHSKVHRQRSIRILVLSSAAAMIAVSFMLFNSTDSKQSVITATAPITITTGAIEVNFVRPTLILNSGRKFDLTSIKNITEVISEKTTDTIIKYNQIVIPKMYNYKMTLEDGTIVHLNSCSELKYPNKFGAEKREVFLSGEAFFEVAKSAVPFIVTVNDVSVRVYGTKFNINTHNDDNIQTTLIEGSVSVSQKGDTTETFIKPNQLLTINRNGEKTINTIIPERYMAWMSGFFRNDEEPISNLLNNIAKWYGIEFTYNENIKNINVSASLNKNRPLEEILNAIQEISGLRITKTENEKYMVK